MSGTETLTGTVTGAAAAKLLNSNSNAGPAFPSLVFTGPVSTTIKGPVGLGGGNAKTATHTFVTPAGNFTVQHTAKTNGQAQPTVTGKSGSTCYFSLNGGTGTYTVIGSKSTGRFAGATGSGTYAGDADRYKKSCGNRSRQDSTPCHASPGEVVSVGGCA